MTTTILLIRHGLTDWNLQKRWQGHEDVPLNDLGRRQARALAERLGNWPIKSIYASDSKRAWQTAEILAGKLALTPMPEPAWRERDVGLFQGLTREDIKKHYPDSFAELSRGIVKPPGGENNQALYNRGAAALEDVIQKQNGEMAAVVSHGGIIHATMLYVLGLEVGDYSRLRIGGNTSITMVETINGRSRLIRLNDTAHLENEALADPF